MKKESKDRLREILNLKELSQADLCRLTGFEKGRVSAWLSGKYKPNQKALTVLSDALGVKEEWLMGYDVPMQKESSAFMPECIKMKQIPLLGDIACGNPALAVNQYDTFCLVDENTKADFCLKVKGDSMIDAGIKDGDIVFCKSQKEVENGEIAVVIIKTAESECEATLKRCFYYPEIERLILIPENKEFTPLTFTGAELNNVEIIGKAVVCQHKL